MFANEAKIFLAEKRGRTETNTHRAFHTFSFGKFNDPNCEPFFALTALNDETLAAGKNIEYNIKSNCIVCVLPLIGGIEQKIDKEHGDFLEAGESQILAARKGSVLHFRNPYETEAVNYSTLWLNLEIDRTLEKFSFDLDREKNSFVRIFSSNTANIHIGKFGGRIDGISPGQQTNGLFAYIIEGAMEFDNRLLQQRDGLALLNRSKVEFESLSTETIMILVEV